MKGLLLIATILLVQTSTIFACCAERGYRLFPIGELDKKVVFIEFKLSRNCKMGTGAGPENEFWTKGTVNLVTTAGDSLTHIETIDTVDFKECTCTYKNFYQKTNYESKLAITYQKALKIAESKDGFKTAQPKNITFNDTLNTRIIEAHSDSSYSYKLKYKGFDTIDLGSEVIISCYPNKVAEIRTYETENFIITILRLRCKLLEEQAIAHNKKRFKKIETAFWKEQAQWHGITKDYWEIKNNKR